MLHYQMSDKKTANCMYSFAYSYIVFTKYGVAYIVSFYLLNFKF